jgi:hypothetical protein
MPWRLPRVRPYKNVELLEDKLRFQRFADRLLEERSKFRIAVIDDEEFTPIAYLRRHGYDVTHFSDIDSIETIERFAIILCGFDWNRRSIESNPSWRPCY